MAVGARSCRACGSDATTGWSDDAASEGVELPAGYGGEEEFDYDAFLARELGVGTASRWRSPAPWIAAVTLAAFVLWVLLR